MRVGMRSIIKLLALVEATLYHQPVYPPVRRPKSGLRCA